MIVTQTESNITVPVSEATVAEIVDSDTVGRQVILTNLDVANTLYYKFQSSTDKVAWSDIGTWVAVSPGASVAVTLTAIQPYLRLRAYGNLAMAMSIHRVKQWTGVFPLVTV